jgi:hypothetical protein
VQLRDEVAQCRDLVADHPARLLGDPARLADAHHTGAAR